MQPISMGATVGLGPSRDSAEVWAPDWAKDAARQGEFSANLLRKIERTSPTSGQTAGAEQRGRNPCGAHMR